MHVANLSRYNVVCSVNLLFFGFVAFFVLLMWRVLMLMCGITAQYAATYRQQDDLELGDFIICLLLLGVGYWTADECAVRERWDEVKRQQIRGECRLRRQAAHRDSIWRCLLRQVSSTRPWYLLSCRIHSTGLPVKRGSNVKLSRL